MAEPYLGEHTRVGRVFQLDSHTSGTLECALEVKIRPLQVGSKDDALSPFVEASRKADANAFEDEVGMSLHEALESGREALGRCLGMRRRRERLLREESTIHIGDGYGSNCRTEIGDENCATLIEAQESWTT